MSKHFKSCKALCECINIKHFSFGNWIEPTRINWIYVTEDNVVSLLYGNISIVNYNEN